MESSTAGADCTYAPPVGHTPGASGRVLSTSLQSYYETLTDEQKWSQHSSKTIQERFPGLEGSELTDMAMFLWATDEHAAYKVVVQQSDGFFSRLRHDMT